jgi:hypothetical protein
MEQRTAFCASGLEVLLPNRIVRSAAADAFRLAALLRMNVGCAFEPALTNCSIGRLTSSAVRFRDQSPASSAAKRER